jgi:hypothetical protein
MTAPKTPDPSDPRAIRRRDDTARFLERFAVLTGIASPAATIEALPREFLARTVPPPTALLERFGYELAPRTHNALCRYEPGRLDEPWTFGRLLQIRGFGVFSLLDLLEVMAKHDGSGQTATRP